MWWTIGRDFQATKRWLVTEFPKWVKSNQRQGEDAHAGAGFFRKDVFSRAKNGTGWFFKELSHLCPGGSSARYRRAPWDLQGFMDKNRDVVATDFWKKRRPMFGVDGQKFGYYLKCNEKSMVNKGDKLPSSIGPSLTQWFWGISKLCLTRVAWILARKTMAGFPSQPL